MEKKMTWRTGAFWDLRPCLANNTPLQHILLHSTTLFTSFFQYIYIYIYIKSFTFYIASFTIQIKKITTKQIFILFNTTFSFFHSNHLFFIFFIHKQYIVILCWGMWGSLPNTLLMTDIRHFEENVMKWLMTFFRLT